MKLTWHIIKKDLVRMRLPLGLWALLLAAHVAVGFVLITADGFDAQWLDDMALADHLLTALDIVVNYVLVAELIQGDSLVGSQVFWMTRPISGLRLFGAKLLGMVIMFGMIPLAILLPWWLNCGYGLAEIGWATAEILLLRMLITMVALLVAVLTDGLGRFLVWSLVLAVGAFTVPLTIAQTFNSFPKTISDGNLIRPAGLTFITYVSDGVLITRVGLAIIACVFGIGVVAVNQFFTRRTLRSAGVACIVFLLAATIISEFPRDWSGWWHDHEEQDTPLPENVTVTFDNATFRNPIPDDSVDRAPILAIRFHVRNGLLKQTSWLLGRGEHAWRWPDGSTVTLRRTDGDWFDHGFNGPEIMPSLGLPNLDWNKKDSDIRKFYEARWAANGLPRNNQDPESWSVSERFFDGEFSQQQLKRIRFEHPAFEATLHFQMLRPELLFDCPLASGPRQIHSPESWRIVKVEKRNEKTSDGKQNDRLRATLVITEPPLLDGRIVPYARTLLGQRPNRVEYAPGYLSLVAVNRSKDNSIPATVSGPNNRSIVVGAVEIAWETISIYPPWRLLNGKWVPGPEDWLDSLSLARVVSHEEARFVRTIRVDPFKVVEASVTGNPKSP